jgi:hypothetical protein
MDTKPAATSTKYAAVRTTIDGVTFASKKEATRYKQLKLLEKGKVISNLQLQPRYPCKINGALICTYVGDFSYTENGKFVLEDVKGILTPVYRLKKKLVKALHGIDIRET